MSKIDDWMKSALRNCGRSHKKRHSVNRERSYEDRENDRQAAEKNAKKARVFRSYKDQMAAYWAGEIDACPERPE